MTLLRLFDHLAWADARALSAIETLPEASAERVQAARLYAHHAAAAHVWLARLEGRAAEHPVWPDLALEAARDLAAQSIAGLRGLAAGDTGALGREIEYRTTTGQVYRNSLGDVLTHVGLHAMYHRGQIAMLVRQGGGTPAATDFIVFARDRHL
jgi:uncharacterized damage-inducible protein DinB